MSITLESSLAWFKKLPLERQLHIVAKALEVSWDSLGIDETSGEFLACILTEASVVVSINTTEDAKHKILAWNLEDAVVTLLIENLKAARPPPKVDAKALMQFDDETFSNMIDGVLNELYLKNVGTAEIANMYKVNPTSIEAALRIVRDSLLFRYIRRELGTETLKQRVESLGFQGNKVKILANKIEQAAPAIEKAMVFRNIQDTYLEMRTVRESLDAIRKSLRELVELIKKATEPSRYVS